MFTSMKRFFFLLPLALPLYVVRFQIGPLPTTLLEIIVLGLVAWWAYERRDAGIRDAWLLSKPWHWPVALWLLAGAIAVMVSPIHLQALGLYRAYFIEPLLIFFIGFDLIRTRDDRERLWRSFSIVTVILTVWAGIQMLTGWGIPHPWGVWPGRRSTGPFPFPNALALFVTPIAALAMARIVSALNEKMEERRSKVEAADSGTSIFHLPSSTFSLDLITMMSGFIAILLAQSDGGLAALAVATMVTLLVHKHSRRFGIEIAIAGFLAIALIPPLRDHVLQIVLFKDWSGMVRTVMWKETILMLKDHALLGAGLAAYPVTILPYHTATWMEVFQYPHSIILNLWSEVGPLGTAAFGWVIVTWMRNMRQSAWRIGTAVVAATLVHGLVDVPYFKNDLAIAFWLLILLTASYETKRTPH